MFILKLFIFFWLFSIMGWILEELVFLIEDHKVVNRGFLIGPYCPIYGLGATIMLIFLPYKDNMLVCFSLSMISCTVIEYIASYIMEKIFGVRWWDYSNDSFNINGRVCLRNAIAFGILGIILTGYLGPFVLKLLDGLNDNAIICISIIVFIITLIDIICSINILGNIKNLLGNIKKHRNFDATQDIKEIMKDKLLNDNILIKRIIDTYHFIEKGKNGFVSKIKNNRVFDYKIMFLCIVIGLFIGIIIGIIIQKIKFIVTIFLLISIIVAIIISRRK